MGIRRTAQPVGICIAAASSPSLASRVGCEMAVPLATVRGLISAALVWFVVEVSVSAACSELAMINPESEVDFEQVYDLVPTTIDVCYQCLRHAGAC